MKMSIGIGHSSKVDGYEAGLEAASTVHEQLGADAPDRVSRSTAIYRSLEVHLATT